MVSKPPGGALRMTLADYAAYMAAQADEEPLYIFDPDFGSHSPELLSRYRLPAVFDQDYFEVGAGCTIGASMTV